MTEPSITLTSLRELSAWSKTDKAKPAGHPARLDTRGTIQTAPQSSPANSEILTSTTNGIQERDKGSVALFLHARKEQVSTGCDGTLGLSQKPTPTGKPWDMPTETRRHGR